MEPQPRGPTAIPTFSSSRLVRSFMTSSPKLMSRAAQNAGWSTKQLSGKLSRSPSLRPLLPACWTPRSCLSPAW